jgi:orotate phosphoribosyltransferase
MTTAHLTDDVRSVFEESGAYLRGHFRLTSGLHSPEYLQCALVLSHPKYAEWLGAELGKAIIELVNLRQVDLVVAPAMGGLIIGHEVARAVGARFIFTERDQAAKMTLRRGFTAKPGETAIVVEDVITTGGSTREVAELMKSIGVNVAAAGSIIDRSGGRVNLGVPRIALATMNVIAYKEDTCPLCKEGVPISKPGSRPPSPESRPS